MSSNKLENADEMVLSAMHILSGVDISMVSVITNCHTISSIIFILFYNYRI